MNAQVLGLFAWVAVGFFTLVHHAEAQNPQTISSDVAIQLFQQPNGVATTFGQGWLRLSLKPGSTDLYTGTFTDNYSGGKIFPASASISSTGGATLTIQTRTGKFIADPVPGFTSSQFYTETFTRVPFVQRPGTGLYLLGVPHRYTTLSGTLRVNLWSGVNGKKKPFIFAGLPITLIRDALNHMAPKDPETGARSFVIVQGKKGPVIQNITGPGIFYLPTTFLSGSSNFLTLNLKLNGRSLMLCGVHGPETGMYTGSAVSPGKATAATIGSFQVDLNTSPATASEQEEHSELVQ